jgi:hypothetical protein
MSMQSITLAGIPARRLRDRLPPKLRGWRLALLLGSAGLAAGMAWQWSWLVAIGVVPVLLSVAPCAAMCGLGLCASKLVGGSCRSNPGGGGPLATGTMLTAQSDASENTILKGDLQ